MKFYKQLDSMDCGPTCIKMVAKYYGKEYSLDFLRTNCFLSKEGVSLLGISQAAEKIGFTTLAAKVSPEQLYHELPLPAILHWNQEHFVVMYKVNKKYVWLADPGHGLIKLIKSDFERNWLGDGNEGIALMLEPTPDFYSNKEELELPKRGFSFLIKYLRPFKKYIAQILLSMLVASGLTLIFPFLTQVLVDNGINHRNISLVVLVLIAQITLFFSSTLVELIRSWLMLHINSRVNILIISDFLIKLMRLPISYFDSKLVGDIQQRIGDHERVQTFLTGSALSTFFSLINLLIFTLVLGIYSLKILTVFIIFSLLGISWILIFLSRRKRLDYIRFQNMTETQNVMFELITGMQEIKLNNCETKKRWGWERMQAKIFNLNIKSLTLNQTQQIGSVFFNQLKNIFITYLSAREVITGDMSIGMMMSVSYIIGQLNAPIENILAFIQHAQDAKISLDRLSEIHMKDNEDFNISRNELLHYDSNIEKSIAIRNLSFQYQGPNSPFALKDINLSIPYGKVTAIVGSSGSGKTTLVKLLLQFYKATAGEILVDHENINNISPFVWRTKCGTVMQEGILFSDTIANNIAISDEKVDHKKLKQAVEISNIKTFIEGLPLGYNSKIGQSGSGISTGQKQRILIARAIYKNPEYLFFDEATSALDANNEKIIIENLEQFYKNRTVIIVAHRLSTVKHADQIVVLDQGSVAELGTHQELVQKKGKYFELIKNQLELGN